MRVIETPWGKMLPREVVKLFLDMSVRVTEEEGVALKAILFELWIVSPEYGEMAAYIVLKRRLAQSVLAMAKEILVRGPIVERLTEKVTDMDSLRKTLSLTRNDDELVLTFNENQNGLEALSVIWRRIGDTFSVTARVEEFVKRVIESKYLPGLRLPILFSAMPELSGRAGWLAPKIFRGIKEVKLVRRAEPMRGEAEKETMH